jgi:hypothetical protein
MNPVPREHDLSPHHWQGPGQKFQVLVVSVSRAPGVPQPEYRFQAAAQ